MTEQNFQSDIDRILNGPSHGAEPIRPPQSRASELGGLLGGEEVLGPSVAPATEAGAYDKALNRVEILGVNFESLASAKLSEASRILQGVPDRIKPGVEAMGELNETLPKVEDAVKAIAFEYGKASYEKDATPIERRPVEVANPAGVLESFASNYHGVIERAKGGQEDGSQTLGHASQAAGEVAAEASTTAASMRGELDNALAPASQEVKAAAIDRQESVVRTESAAEDVQKEISNLSRDANDELGQLFPESTTINDGVGDVLAAMRYMQQHPSGLEDIKRLNQHVDTLSGLLKRVGDGAATLTVRQKTLLAAVDQVKSSLGGVLQPKTEADQ